MGKSFLRVKKILQEINWKMSGAKQQKRKFALEIKLLT